MRTACILAAWCTILNDETGIGMTVLQILLMTALFAQGPARPTLDYAFYKAKVEPIFLKKRPGHARCVTCHEHGVPPLVPLAAGAASWSDEDSRKNFAVWKQFVVPGNPLKSSLLRHPLAEAAGGDRFHAGGKHWKSQNDPEWQILAAWARGETLGGSK
jgi:hypothetical protein